MRAAQSRSDSVSYSREELRADPGVYMISVASNAVVESDFALEVHRSAGSSAPPLAAEDQAAMETVRPDQQPRMRAQSMLQLSGNNMKSIGCAMAVVWCAWVSTTRRVY